MNHVYTHATKAAVNDVMFEYVNMVKTRYEKKVAFIRLDGEKTLGNDFNALLTNNGISSERSAVNTQQQNGNAERSGG
ncbi:uncharacterized protein Z518_02584 [Rhinocladiella mackenziei CBS 650.93]|uniref:Integrase catalytic domain-containing protein n=1 Tax=Rhinocladiella mackenziei CBS 650.93 TaxID=1442369 RepID=A0A0D2JFC0_9EURO|nr:uncharacterized protein Z518_02584 [Rhinocladiella mackenziei CBS 650.93]KIX07930.1 hypothetical protein Z518_02584 [Rhinocladiella mackenziei CBS 650.93]